MCEEQSSRGAALTPNPLSLTIETLYTPLCCEVFFYKELGPLFHWLRYTYWEHDTYKE